MHQRGIIHRDIKPQNIFLDEAKDARLGDLGLAVRYPDTSKLNKISGAANTSLEADGTSSI